MSDVTRIAFPWPDKRLFPNWKRSHHWRLYRNVEKAYRAEWAWLTKAARLRVEPGLVPLTITFHPPDRRNRDDDGMIGAIKNGRDGLADALGVDDKVFRPTYQIAEPTPGGLVVVELEG